MAGDFIWANKNIIDKGKCLWFKHWIKAGFKHVKDIFDKEGNLLTPNKIYEKVTEKRNWCCEYIIVKNSIKSYCKDINTRDFQKVNIKKVHEIWYEGQLRDVTELCSKNFYWVFVEGKAQRNYMEKVWANRLGCDSMCDQGWSKIYINKCHTFHDVRINMFNYKILTNSLPSPLVISKWNKEMTTVCEKCDISDSITHILYECNEVKEVWNKVSKCIDVEIL